MKTKIKKFYEKGHFEEGLHNLQRDIKRYLENEKRYLLDTIESGSSIIDIGCGDGRVLSFLKEKSSNLFGIDFSTSLVEKARINVPGAQIYLEDAEKTHFEDNSFDCVICVYNTLGNFNSKKLDILREMKRIVKENGKIIISVYANNVLKSQIEFYKSLGLNIEKIDNDAVYTKEGLISERFSKNKLDKLVSEADLVITKSIKISPVAYLYELKKIRDDSFKVLGLYPQKRYTGPGREIEYLEPLGLEYILGIAKDRDCKVELLTLYNNSEKEIIEKISNFNPDVLAVSCMTSQFKTGLKIAVKIKKSIPGIKIVFGGYHPSTFPNIVQNKIVDFCVIGEGERTFGELLDHFMKGKEDYDSIKGISFIKNGKLIITLPRGRAKSLDEFPEPFRVEFLKELKNYGLVYPAVSKQTGFASLDYSRGCFFNCDFCASPKVLGRMVSWKSSRRIIREIKELNKKQGINTFFFTDLNFTASKERVIVLCNALIKSKLKIYWECMSNIITADDKQLLKKMYEAGCRKVAWGIESVSENVLKKMKKPLNLRMDYQVLKKAESVGILNSGFYIIGEPSETKKQILSYPKKLSKLPLHRVRVGIYTPLPGSMLYERTKKKVSKNMNLFDTEHLVFKHPNLKKKELEGLRVKITKLFYQNKAYKKRIKSMVKKFPEYENVFTEFFSQTFGKYFLITL